MKWDDLNGTGSKVWVVIWIDDEDFRLMKL